LIKLIKQRMNGVDQAGTHRPTTTVGGALNMCAEDLDHEPACCEEDRRRRGFRLPGRFDPAAIERFHRRYEEIEGQPLTLPVLMAVMPLYSLKHALFLHNEVPGISIPKDILKRIEDAGADAPQEGVRIAQELLRTLRGVVQGTYIVPPTATTSWWLR
jgi:homocysteine S-methyltransferase